MHAWKATLHLGGNAKSLLRLLPTEAVVQTVSCYPGSILPFFLINGMSVLLRVCVCVCDNLPRLKKQITITKNHHNTLPPTFSKFPCHETQIRPLRCQWKLLDGKHPKTSPKVNGQSLLALPHLFVHLSTRFLPLLAWNMSMTSELGCHLTIMKERPKESKRCNP